jgi:hypothetical protein
MLQPIPTTKQNQVDDSFWNRENAQYVIDFVAFIALGILVGSALVLAMKDRNSAQLNPVKTTSNPSLNAGTFDPTKTIRDMTPLSSFFDPLKSIQSPHSSCKSFDPTRAVKDLTPLSSFRF